MLFQLNFVLSAFRDAQVETVRVLTENGSLHFNRVNFNYLNKQMSLLIVEKENDYFVVI